ncbi:response regulator transcription factor [Candidatus Margulisiibacteriota bacterium]
MSQRSILIVDDEEDIVRALSIRLASMGYQLFTAADGLTGLEIARAEKPDLILLDVMLPKLDGFKVCRMLKYDEKFKRIPIIMLTAKVTDVDQVMGRDVGANEYLTKPFDPDRLVELVEKYAGKA